MHEITIIQPDDWHLHLRDGEVLANLVPHTAERFGRAVIMPNLTPPITTVAAAIAYKKRIQAQVPAGNPFQALMTLYLTDNTSADEIRKAAASNEVYAVKLYPAGATTNSDSGVSDIAKCYDAIAAMEETGLPLLVHGEVTNKEVDVFDREAVFIEKILTPLHTRFPKLKLVLEHITTRHGVDFVNTSNANVGGTITPQHLMFNRNALFQGGIRPHHYCLPVLKREEHRLALLEAATSGNTKFFLGTDSAPHSKNRKENACGCAGIYSSHAAIELYAMIFEQANRLDKLEGFASKHGADFYGLPYNNRQITLIKETWKVPDSYPFASETIVPFLAGENIGWTIK